MRKYFILLIITAISCNPKKIFEKNQAEITDCNDEWEFKTNVTEKKINDSTIQEIVNGKVWFEIISPKENNNGIVKAYIKNYRMDGSLLSEGFAEYYEHPVADHKQIGVWKFYDCNGKQIKNRIYY